jgi:hypoxanthine phosphoribosyltransferase
MDKRKISNEDIQQLVNKLCRDISLSGWRPDYVVGLTRGGLIPAVMISHYFNVPMHSLNVSLRDSDIGPESNCWMAEDAYGYQDSPKRILIVDDINDSGATFNWIKQDWQSSCAVNDERWNYVWGESTRFAVLFENLASEFDDVTYRAEEINKAENDVWIDFPWEDWWTK